jgi:hypothetical protein
MAPDLTIGKLPSTIMDQYLDGGASFPVSLYGGYDADGVVHACGGLAWVDGRCIAFVDVFRPMSRRSVTLVRWARRVLRVAKQLGETEVLIYRDAWQPKSHRLVSMLGFELVGVIAGETAESGVEIYACRV